MFAQNRTRHLFRFALAGSAVALLAATLASGIGRPGGAAAQEATPAAAPQRTITVSGHGAVTVTPDTASIQIGVEAIQPTLEAAQSQATQQMTAVINTIKAAGVDEKDIQTTNYSVNIVRQHDQSGNPGKITGFDVSNTVNVTLRDLTKLGSLLDAVVAEGANTIYGISFSVGDPSQAATQARTLAVQDAKQKAEELATAAGARVGRVLTITETSAPPPSPVAMETAGMAKAASAPVPVQAGSAEIDVDVQVVFELAG